WINERIASASKATDKKWLEGFIRLSRSGNYFDLSEEIKKITVPTLLICADEDIVTPKSEMKKMAEKIPHSSLVVLHKTGHAAFYEKANLWIKKVESFLSY
ncbi:MAG: alpha/beta fold hydrolase, partial [Athalassotoga sp.]|uniref:alpha/beta fold hydrolase n=1 Tax=Athalassotoga sp. TaxID=2022597 RepID=UPI003D04C51B